MKMGTWAIDRSNVDAFFRDLSTVLGHALAEEKQLEVQESVMQQGTDTWRLLFMFHQKKTSGSVLIRFNEQGVIPVNQSSDEPLVPISWYQEKLRQFVPVLLKQFGSSLLTYQVYGHTG